MTLYEFIIQTQCYHVLPSLIVVYLTMDINPSLAKLPLKFNGSLAELGLTSLQVSNF